MPKTNAHHCRHGRGIFQPKFALASGWQGQTWAGRSPCRGAALQQMAMRTRRLARAAEEPLHSTGTLA